MQAYKFKATVQEDGIIQIPEISKFANHQVEIFIIVEAKPDISLQNAHPIDDFLNKWTGILKDVDPDALKDQYLQEKYG